MNGENYTPYYYNYSTDQTNNQSWGNWNYQQPPYLQQNFNRNPSNNGHPPPPPIPPSHIGGPPGFHKPTQANGNLPNRPFFRNNRFTKPTQFSNNNQPLLRYPNQNSFKRQRSDSEQSETQLKTGKKKKKSLSQNVPRRDWTLAEAECALALEKELNKKSKVSLIVKFPDHELSKEIVTQFNSAIESVHFQQPCTPRFCYVTLQDNANAEEVLSDLNKQKFGSGCIIAEYKRDREDDLVVNAEDIDPLTLYVGNLAQEVTKEDILTMFPNNKRMDIGFAKKMKFTRYAFIVFRSVKDSIEAFKNAHNKELRNKSLIVRFRRLHGTVGMPGEAKQQNAPKGKEDAVENAAPPIVNGSGSKDALKEVGNRSENSNWVEILGSPLTKNSDNAVLAQNQVTDSTVSNPTLESADSNPLSETSTSMDAPISSLIKDSIALLHQKINIKQELDFTDDEYYNFIMSETEGVSVKEELDETTVLRRFTQLKENTNNVKENIPEKWNLKPFVEPKIKKENIKEEPVSDEEFPYDNNDNEFMNGFLSRGNDDEANNEQSLHNLVRAAHDDEEEYAEIANATNSRFT